MHSSWTRDKFSVKVLGEDWTVFVRNPKVLDAVARHTGCVFDDAELYGLTVPMIDDVVVNRMFISTNIPSVNLLIDTIAHEVFHMVCTYANVEEEKMARHCGRTTASLIRRMVPASGLDR